MQPTARGLLRLLLLPHARYSLSSGASTSLSVIQQQLVHTLAQDELRTQHKQLIQQLLARQLHQAAASSHLQPQTAAIAWGSSCCRHYSSGAGDGVDGGGGAASSRSGRDLAIVFTCGKCETRSVKTFSRQAYERGVVLVTCPGCQAMHLIADHLGWFGDSGFKIDEYLQQQGQQVKRVALNNQDAAAADLTANDLAGWSKVQQLLTAVTTAATGSDSQGSTSGGCCGSSNGSSGRSASDGVAAESSHDGSSASASAAGEGVMQVAPEDVEAWVRVQQQQQEQGSA